MPAPQNGTGDQAADITGVLEPLNKAQRAAVTASDRQLLVLAGAGSGKTRVLAHRVAWYIATGQAQPSGILAVTFTNKAAREMRGRIEALLGYSTRGMWLGTFHGMAHRILRAHGSACGLADDFQIIDATDQKRLIRRLIRELGVDEKKFPASAIQHYINRCKDATLRPAALEEDREQKKWAAMLQVYTRYQEVCDRAGLVDFSELLLRVWELLSQREDILQLYRQRFLHLLIDEFQDTNDLQYRWFMLMNGPEGSLFAVGDDDQSIYGWRGARVQNMQDFRDSRQARVVRLEQNYRSTKTILEAANALIACNQGRLGKKLWTDGAPGAPVSLYQAYHERDEARHILGQICEAVHQGSAWGDHALLYRVSALSRVLEEECLRSEVPYRVYGGLRFYERAEIKDAVAWLRLVCSADDDSALERVINVPLRGIGQRTLDALREQARSSGLSLWQACHALSEQQALPARSIVALKGFSDLLGVMTREAAQQQSLQACVQAILRLSGLEEHYLRDGAELAQSRIENLRELVSAASLFQPEDLDQDQARFGTLQAFVTQATLEAGEQQAAPDDCVHLMTLHLAKGLEFPRVFMLAMEEGMLPHELSLASPAQLEEERRLCYVGMTRARQRLDLSWAQHRRLHGRDYRHRASRFVRELPLGLCQSAAHDGPLSEAGAPGELAVGQQVQHRHFGQGTVLHLEGDGSHTRVQVRFEDGQCKWLLLGRANLQILTASE